MRSRSPRFLAAVALATALSPAAARAQGDLDLGTSSYQFLKLPLAPRVVAMGGAGVALAEGPAEAEINPAAAARAGGALVVGQEYPAAEFGTSASHISWNLPWGTRRVAVHARYLGFDDIPGWDDDNNATTPYQAHTIKLQAGLAGSRLGFDWGAGAAWARNNVADASYSALLMNAGLRRGLAAKGLLSGFSAGAAVMNLPLWAGESQSAAEPVEPPTILQAGLGYTRALRADTRLALVLDARKVGDDEAVFPVGAEVTYLEALSLRAGYPLADPDNGIALGVGLRWSRFGFHYAYKGHSTLSGGHGWVLEIRDL
jgi:hypothetical protein